MKVPTIKPQVIVVTEVGMAFPQVFHSSNMLIVWSVLTVYPVVVVVVVYSGPNDLNLFQPVDNATSTQLALNDLALKLVLFYNSKVRAKKVIVGLGCSKTG